MNHIETIARTVPLYAWSSVSYDDQVAVTVENKSKQHVVLTVLDMTDGRTASWGSHRTVGDAESVRDAFMADRGDDFHDDMSAAPGSRIAPRYRRALRAVYGGRA